MIFLENKDQDPSDFRILPWQVRANTEPIMASVYFNSGALICVYQYWNLPSVLRHQAALFWLFWLSLWQHPWLSQAMAPCGHLLSLPTRWLCPVAPVLSQLSQISLLILLSPVRRDCSDPAPWLFKHMLFPKSWSNLERDWETLQ